MPRKRKRSAARIDEIPQSKRQPRSSDAILSSSTPSSPKKHRVASRARRSRSSQEEADEHIISEADHGSDTCSVPQNNLCLSDESNIVRISSPAAIDEVESRPALSRRRGKTPTRKIVGLERVESTISQDTLMDLDTKKPVKFVPKSKHSTAVLSKKTHFPRLPVVEICTPTRSSKQPQRHASEYECSSPDDEIVTLKQIVAVQSLDIPSIPKSSIPDMQEGSNEEDDSADAVRTLDAKSSSLDSMPSTELLGSVPDHLLPCFNSFKCCLLKSLRCPNLTSMSDTEDPVNGVAMKQLADLINGTVHRAEGNSCLLLGPRGSGKSKIIEACIQDVASQNSIILRLSGFVQTTDRHALREIAFQLLQQTESSFFPHSEKAQDVVGSESQDVETDNPIFDAEQFPDEMPSLPPSSQLHALIPVLLTLRRPVIVILDAFDLFALHPRQSLLYSLLDTVQNCRSNSESRGFTVIGITNRINAIELLEKRVKSRFSGRTIRTSSFESLQSYMKIARAVLHPPLDHQESRNELEWKKLWRASVDKFFEDKNVVSALSETFGIVKDFKVLIRILTSCVLPLTPNQPYLSYKTLSASIEFQRSRLRTIHLNNLSYPALCLLIASVHADTAGHKVFTFEMIYDSFQAQIRALASAPVQVNGGNIGMIRCPREVLMSAFENLIACNIFISAAAVSSYTAKQFMKYRCDVDRLQIKALVDKAGTTNLKKWLNKNQ